jgi:hypothetical protein
MIRLALVFLGWTALAGCSGGGPAVLTASLDASPPGAGFLPGGSIDSVARDAATGRVTVTGWHMLTPQTGKHDLKIYAAGARSVESITAISRPDVAEAIGDPELAMAGFSLVLIVAPGAELTELCISMDDKHYGQRLLNPHTPEQVRCTSLGQ